MTLAHAPPLARPLRSTVQHGCRAALAIALVAAMALSSILVVPAALGAPVRAAGTHPPPALRSAAIVIYPNGTLSNASAPISRGANNLYTLTGSLSGSIVVERTGAQLVGAGNTLAYAGGGNGWLITTQASNISISGFDFGGLPPQGGIWVNASTNVSIEANDFALPTPACPALGAAYCTASVYAIDSSGVTIESNELSNASSTTVDLSNVVGATIQGNSFTGSVGWAIYAVQSSQFNVSHNTAFGTLGVYFPYDTDFGVYANNISYSNVSAEGNGFVSTYSSYAVVADNVLLNDAYPFASSYDHNMTFEGNNITATPSFGRGSESVNLQNDTLTSFVDNSVRNVLQVYVYDDNHLNVSGNTIRANWGVGLYLDHSMATTADGNTFSAEPIGIEVLGGSVGLVLSGDRFQAPAVGEAVYVSNSQRIEFTNLAVALSLGTAIQVVGSNAVSFEDVAVMDSATSVLMSGDSNVTLRSDSFQSAGRFFAQGMSGNLTIANSQFFMSGPLSVDAAPGSGTGFLIEGNTFTGEEYPLSLANLTGGLVEGNVFLDSTGASAVAINASSTTSFLGNNVSGGPTNGAAFLAQRCYALTIESNWFGGAGIAFSLVNTNNSLLIQNKFADDASAYSLTGRSVDNSIYHNDFFSDGPGTISTASTANAWNGGYPTAGNYWSNHTTPDLKHGPGQNLTGPDGIVDYPLSLGGSVEDAYPLVSPWNTRNLTFEETGLPSHAPWSVTVNGTLLQSTGSVISYYDPYGAYTEFSYSILGSGQYVAVPASGSVWINESTVVVLVTFESTVYSVQFTEHGLNAGTNWTVQLGSQRMTENTPTIGFLMHNGSYAYQVVRPVSYTVAPEFGNLTVSGLPISVSVQFNSTRTYELTFAETGLPSGTAWSVKVDGTLLTGSTSTLSEIVHNGTHTYSGVSASGYTAKPTSGNVNVQGAPVTVSVSFTVVEYALTFAETGLPAATNWTVTVRTPTGNLTRTDNTSRLIFSLPPGQYAWVVLVSGYNATPGQGALTLAANSTIVVSLAPMPTSAPGNAWTTLDTILLAIGVAGAALVALTLILLALSGRRRRPNQPRVHRRGPIREWRR